jgi:hypothetical protein
MTKYTDFDDGGSTAEGPFLAWHPHPSRDGQIPAFVWTLRDRDGQRAITPAPMTAMLLDIPSLRTGWEYSNGVTGVAPQRRWNASITKFEPRPGDDWKRLHSVMVAFDQQHTALWSQSGFASWSAISDVMALIRADIDTKLPLLPILRSTGHRQVDTRRGPTYVPTFALVKWTPRPTCLSAASSGFDDGGDNDAIAVPSPPRPATKAVSAAHAEQQAAALVSPFDNDEIPF